jgi:hypothetical protein
MLKGFSPYLFGGLEFLDIFCVLDEALDYCIGLCRPILRLVFWEQWFCFFLVREVFLGVWNLVWFLHVPPALDGPADLDADSCSWSHWSFAVVSIMYILRRFCWFWVLCFFGGSLFFFVLSLFLSFAFWVYLFVSLSLLYVCLTVLFSYSCGVCKCVFFSFFFCSFFEVLICLF